MAVRSVAADLTVRAAGLAMILVGVLAGAALVRHGSRAPAIDEMAVAWAALAVAGVAPGALLACLGRHIYDPVPLSDRWRVYAQRQRAARARRR